MSLTAFEIRLELLKMARELLIDEYNHKCEHMINNWKLHVENAHAAGNVPPDQPNFPNYPTEFDIVKKVEHLNSFVSNTPAESIKNTRKT
jgi:hypothetical protein